MAWHRRVRGLAGGRAWRRAGGMLVLGLALASAGCLEFGERITVRRDGSGVIELQYSVDEALVPALAEAQRQVEGWQTDEPGEVRVHDLRWCLNEKLARRHFSGPGMVLEHAGSTVRDGRRQVSIVCAVKSVPQALADGRFGDFRWRRDAEGNITITADLAEDAAAAPVPANRLEEVRRLCRGLKLRLEFRLPVDVTATTGARPESHRAVWAFDAADPAQAAFLERPPRIELTFPGQTLKWE